MFPAEERDHSLKVHVKRNSVDPIESWHLTWGSMGFNVLSMGHIDSQTVTRRHRSFWVPLIFLGVFLFLLPLQQGNLLSDDFWVIRLVTHGDLREPALDPMNSLDVLRYFHEPGLDSFHLYRPLVALSFRLSYDLFGLEGRGYILTNIFVHLLNAFLVLLLLKKMFPTANSLVRCLAVLVFLLHPLQMCVTTWSAARSDGLSFLFGSLALLVKWSAPPRCLTAGIIVALSVLCKESGLVWLAALPLIDVLSRGKAHSFRSAVKTTLVRALPLFAFLILYFYFRREAVGALDGSSSYGRLTIWELTQRITFSTLKDAIGFLINPIISGYDNGLSGSRSLGFVHGAAVISIAAMSTYSFLSKNRILGQIAILFFLPPLAVAFFLGVFRGTYEDARAAYTPMLAVAMAICASHLIRPKTTVIAATLLILSFLPSTYQLREHWIKSGQAMATLHDALSESLSGVDSADADRIVFLNHRRVVSNNGLFSLRDFPDSLWSRPFSNHDYQLLRVASDDPVLGKEYLDPFPTVFTENTAKTMFVMARFDAQSNRYDVQILHRGSFYQTRMQTITAISPAPFSMHEIRFSDSESRQFRFAISHPSLQSPKFKMTIIASRGKVMDTMITPTSVTSQDGRQTTSFVLPPISTELLKQLTAPTLFGWSISVIDNLGVEIGRSPMSPLLSQVTRE